MVVAVQTCRAPLLHAHLAAVFACHRPLQLVAGTSDGMVCICSCSSSSDSSGWSVTSSFPVGPNLVCLVSGAPVAGLSDDNASMHRTALRAATTTTNIKNNTTAAATLQAVDGAGSHIVVGGEGMQPGIWDLSSGTRVWQGKGGKPNRVGLVDKAFTTALAFLPAGGDAAAAATADGGGSSSIARRFVAGTACAKLQLYDTSAGRRPQKQVVFGETRITSVAPEANGERALLRWCGSCECCHAQPSTGCHFTTRVCCCAATLPCACRRARVGRQRHGPHAAAAAEHAQPAGRPQGCRRLGAGPRTAP
jgi:hypothetical protein